MTSLLLSAALWLNAPAPPKPPQLQGRVVAALLWRPDDPGDRGSLETLKRLTQQYRDGRVVVLAVTAQPGLDEGRLRDAARREEVTFPVGLGAASAAEKALGCPAGCVAVIGPDGEIAGRFPADGARVSVPGAVAKLASSARPGTPLGAQEGEPHPPASVLSAPTGVAFDALSGRVYVADTGHDRVLVLDARGKPADAIGAGERGYEDGDFDAALFDRPRGLARIGDDGLVVSESEAGRLRYIDLKRRMVMTLDTPVLQMPEGLAVSRDRLFATFPPLHALQTYDFSLRKFSPYAGNGRPGLRDGGLPSARFVSPAALAVDGRTLFVADAATTALRAIPLDAPDVRTLETGLPAPPSAIAASSGTLYAALPDGRLFALDASGGAPRLLRSDLADPAGMAVAGGRLLVSEAGSGRVAEVSLSGERLGALPTGGRPLPWAPAPPPSPERREVAAAGGAVRASKTAALRLNLRLPDGWALDPRAPLRYRVAEADGEIRFVERTRKAILERPKLPAKIEFTAQPGHCDVALELDYSYCAAGAARCRTDSARVLVPIEISTQTRRASFDVTLSAP